MIEDREVKQMDNAVDEILKQARDLSQQVQQTPDRQENTEKEAQQFFLEEVSYALTQQEAYLCLKKAGIFKTSGKRAIVYTILMIIAAAGFVVSFLVGQNVNWLVFAIISLLIIAVIWLVPYFQLKRLAKENAKGNVIKAKITEEKITIIGNDSSWKIPLDQTSRLSQGDGLLVFHTQNKQLFAIPERAIRPENLQKVKSLVQKGTRPYQ